jgi:hypothetical protein
MSLITTLPDNKIGADDIQAVNAISNALSNNGSNQYIVTHFQYESGSDSKHYFLNPHITVNDIASVQSNVIINADSTNTVLYYAMPQVYQYNSLNRCYSIKVSLNVTYPTNISFIGSNTPFIDMGGINQTSLPIGKYYLIFKYYLEENVCFYRILK